MTWLAKVRFYLRTLFARRKLYEQQMYPFDRSVARKVAVAMLAACLWHPGCRHTPVQMDVGTSSFVMVEPRRPPPPEPSDKELVEPASRANYWDAQAIHPLVMPVYPRRALAAKAGAATVGVRVAVDANGVVTDIHPSLLAVSVTPTKFANDFREAVEVAVRQWKFEPAKVLYLETATEGEFTYERVTRTETIEAEFDLAFTFTPSGRVEPSPPK